jgi:hypothetical protein
MHSLAGGQGSWIAARRSLRLVVAISCFGALIAVAAIQPPAADACGGRGDTAVAASGSAEDQYCETPPDPTGNGTPVRDLGEGDPSVVPAATAALMSELGDSGADALRAAQRTAPPGEAASASDEDGGSVISGLVGSLSGSNGIGLLLPLLMIASLVAAIAYVIAARRSHSS